MKSNIFIISGPSGAGEDSIINGLKDILPIEKIVTTTTREMRNGEKNGIDYYFISNEQFKKEIKENKFFEWAKEYNDKYYGVTKEEIERVKNSEKIGIWKIEYKGVLAAKKLMPNAISIYISAPIDVMIERIKKRSNVTEDFIRERLEYNKKWIKNKHIYDYEIINEDGKLEESIKKALKIIKSNLNKTLD